MLDAGIAPRRIGGSTVFGDHADPQIHYVLADTPRVRADPEPSISLTLFRGESSGGLLQLETVLGPTEGQLEVVRQALSSAGQRPPRLVRPDWRSGTLHLAGWLRAEDLQPLVLSVGIPSLVGDPSCTVAARLDHAAAAMAEQALRGGDALPTTIIYALELLGLAGPLGIEAEADLQAIHDRLTAEGALTTPYGRARLAKTWESFAKDNLIRMRVIDESGDVESRRAEALTRVGNELVAKMFSPVPPPEAPALLGNEAIAAIELSFKLTMRREELATSSRWSYLERSARRIEHYAAASLIGVLRDSPVDRHVFYADLAPPSLQLVVRAEPELQALGLAALEVTLRLGPTPESMDESVDPSAVEPLGSSDLAVTLTPEQTEARLQVQRDPTEPLHYRVRARFDPEQTRASERQTPWFEALGSAVVLSARRLFPPRSLAVVTGRLELDWLDHVQVDVQAPDPQEPARTLVLGDDVRSARADFVAPGDGPLVVTAHFHGKDGEPSRAEAPREVPSGQELLVLDGPFGDSVDVLVVPLPSPGVSSLVVELELRPELAEWGGWVHAKSVDWALPDAAARKVALRRPRGARARYWHRTTAVREDGAVEVSEWAWSEAPTLVVPPTAAPVTVVRTEVFVLGGGPAGRGSLAIELVLHAGDASTSALLEGSADQATLVLVAPTNGPVPELVVREIMSTGETREQRIPAPPALTVIPPPPAPDPGVP